MRSRHALLELLVQLPAAPRSPGCAPRAPARAARPPFQLGRRSLRSSRPSAWTPRSIAPMSSRRPSADAVGQPADRRRRSTREEERGDERDDAAPDASAMSRLSAVCGRPVDRCPGLPNATASGLPLTSRSAQIRLTPSRPRVAEGAEKGLERGREARIVRVEQSPPLRRCSRRPPVGRTPRARCRPEGRTPGRGARARSGATLSPCLAQQRRVDSARASRRRRRARLGRRRSDRRPSTATSRPTAAARRPRRARRARDWKVAAAQSAIVPPRF